MGWVGNERRKGKWKLYLDDFGYVFKRREAMFLEALENFGKTLFWKALV